MPFGLYKNLDPVLICNKCKQTVEDFSNTYIIWNILDKSDNDISIMETLLMHEECLTEMVYEFSDTDMEPGDFKTIKISDYIINLLKRYPLESRIIILNENSKGIKYEH
mgnify:CR=1 FL=1